MAYEIVKEKCIMCGSCAEICSVNAIKYLPTVGVYQIKQDACIDCGACEPVCCSGAARPAPTN